MGRGWASARWKGIEEFCRGIDNHGWQHTSEGNLEAKKRNRKQLRESNLEKQRGNNRKKSKGGKRPRQSRMSQRRHGKEENENFGKRGPSSNKNNLSEFLIWQLRVSEQDQALRVGTIWTVTLEEHLSFCSDNKGNKLMQRRIVRSHPATPRAKQIPVLKGCYLALLASLRGWFCPHWSQESREVCDCWLH